jgi:hypothetical protein
VRRTRSVLLQAVVDQADVLRTGNDTSTEQHGSGSGLHPDQSVPDHILRAVPPAQGAGHSGLSRGTSQVSSPILPGLTTRLSKMRVQLRVPLSCLFFSFYIESFVQHGLPADLHKLEFLLQPHVSDHHHLNSRAV